MFPIYFSKLPITLGYGQIRSRFCTRLGRARTRVVPWTRPDTNLCQTRPRVSSCPNSRKRSWPVLSRVRPKIILVVPRPLVSGHDRVRHGVGTNSCRACGGLLATTNLSSLASSIFPTQLSFKLKAKSMYKTNWTKMKMKPAIKPNTYQTVVNGATVQV